jgi:hypothetical protein
MRAAEVLEVITVPSPGAVIIDDFLTPASYCNFYIANRAVLLPAYGVPGDELARAALAPHFPGREVVLVPTRGLIVGGGGLHCASAATHACQRPRSEAMTTRPPAPTASCALAWCSARSVAPAAARTWTRWRA